MKPLVRVLGALLLVLGLGVAALAGYGGFALVSEDSHTNWESAFHTLAEMSKGYPWSRAECQEVDTYLDYRKGGQASEGLSTLWIAYNDHCE